MVSTGTGDRLQSLDDQEDFSTNVVFLSDRLWARPKAHTAHRVDLNVCMQSLVQEISMLNLPVFMQTFNDSSALFRHVTLLLHLPVKSLYVSQTGMSVTLKFVVALFIMYACTHLLHDRKRWGCWKTAVS